MLGTMRSTIADVQAGKLSGCSRTAAPVWILGGPPTHLWGQHHAHILPPVQQRHGLQEEVGVGYLGRGAWGCLGWLMRLGRLAKGVTPECRQQLARLVNQQAPCQTAASAKQPKIDSSHPMPRTWSASNTQSTSVSGMSWPAGYICLAALLMLALLPFISPLARLRPL